MTQTKPKCLVAGMITPGAMCGSSIQAKYCGFAGNCEHKETQPAQPQPVNQALKERPDFIAGYDAGMADAKRMQALAQAETQPAQPLELSAMVDAFLSWRLPDDFGPDAYISFDREKAKEHLAPYGGWPTGTNLLSADQARAMFEYVIAAANKKRSAV